MRHLQDMEERKKGHPYKGTDAMAMKMDGVCYAA
jgi:hypothetical protein